MASQEESGVGSQDESDAASEDESSEDSTLDVEDEEEICIPEIDEQLEATLNTGNFETMQEVLNNALVEGLKSPSSSITSIRYYLSRGADVFCNDPGEQSTMGLAVSRGDYDIIELLIEYGADAMDLDRESYKNIIKFDRMDILKLLLSSCDDKPELIEKMEDDLDDYTPLYWALRYRQLHIIKFLIHQGMDVDCFVDNNTGYNLLHCAAADGDVELTDFLLELGASVYRCASYINRLLPFQIAASRGHVDLAMKLLPKDINAPDPKPKNWIQSVDIDDSGFTMLMYACYAEDESSAKMLIEKGADPNKAVRGILPLQVAIWNRQQEIVDYLYPLTDLSLIKWQKDLLDEAVCNCLDIEELYPDNPTVGGKPLLTYLLEAGVEVDQTIEQFETGSLLMTACTTGNADHVNILLEHGAQINIQCQCSETPGLCNMLFCAVKATEKYQGLKVLKIVLRGNLDVLYLSRIKVKPKWRTFSLPDELAVNYKCTTVVQEALLSKNSELIRICVESGCCLYDTKVILDAVKDSIEPPLQPHIIELIEKYDSSPRSLQHLAKFALRRCFGHKDVDAKIDSLPLPKHVKDYLKYLGF